MDFEEKLDKRVKELEEKLKKTSENMRKAKENGNDEQYARESSNHTKLTEEIRSLQKTKEAFEKINRQIKDKQKQLNSISNRMKNARKDGKNDEYDKLKPLDDDDLDMLAAMLSFPEKFWKIINQYYNAGKAWVPAKNIEKLKTVIAQNMRRRELIDKMCGL